MLISNQGIRPGSINMGRLLRSLRHHSDMSRKVVYHRPPIFTKDDYGVETGETDTAELLLPQLPALIRPALTADYQLERGGGNIIGAARVYTPNLQTIKGFDNFNQANNTNFNEIEGWDRFIDVSRYIYHTPTSGTAGWTSGSADVTFASDGEKITATLGTDAEGSFYYTTGATNTLEADRIQFKIKASGTVSLDSFKTYNGATQTAANALTYTPASLNIPTDSWLTVDVPFVTGTVASGTSIYDSGTRYAVTVASGASFTYVQDFRDFEFNVSGSDEDIVYVKDIKFYKSISWHVHSVKEINSQFIIYNTVRTRGKRDSRRRAYDT